MFDRMSDRRYRPLCPRANRYRSEDLHRLFRLRDPVSVQRHHDGVAQGARRPTGRTSWHAQSLVESCASD